MCGGGSPSGGGGGATYVPQAVQASAPVQAQKELNEYAHNQKNALAAASNGDTISTTSMGLLGDEQTKNAKLKLGG